MSTERWRFALVALTLTIILAACGSPSSSPASDPPAESDSVRPSPSASEPAAFAPFMSAPFEGSFPTINALDHDIPLEFIDTNGVKLAYWGEAFSFFDGHGGYDWALPEGTPLLAAFDGTVEFAGVADPFFCPTLGREVTDQGSIVLTTRLAGGEEYAAYYAHGVAEMRTGQRVEAGDRIGVAANNGCTTQPHLHFEVYRDTNTNSGERTTVDPYGWTGPGADPWHEDSRGAESLELWLSGEGPEVYFETFLASNTGGATAPVTITTVRWAGVDDAATPNNEFVLVALDTRYSGASLFRTGYTLENNAGLSYAFIDGLELTTAEPSIRVYSGSGTDTHTEFYWGQSAPVWDNFDDCAQLVDPAGGRYLFITGLGAGGSV